MKPHGLVGIAKYGGGGQRILLDAMQKINPRVGYIRAPNSIGWDLRYPVENSLSDGTRQLVVAPDKPVSFAAAAGGGDTMDYPFTLVEMQMNSSDKGEGKIRAATSITVQNGRLELEKSRRSGAPRADH